MDELEEKVQRYLELNSKAVGKIRIAPDEDSYLHGMALDFLKMIESYSSDASYFASKGDLINAFAALNYVHGWIDAGARIGIFKVDHDHELFTLFK
ncbi:MAG: DUF357 domain-containing protein [Candidatus Thermoplasmatota archaeon]|nr:DUF357 domain-containing protein [Candidatus Thermoplasmatota archaeon]